VALEAIFRQLVKQIQGLHEALHYLNLAVGDQPEDDGAMLADDLDEVVLNLIGVVHEARRAALNASKAVTHPLDLDAARRALTACQERFHHIEQEFVSKVIAYDKLRALAVLAGERRGEWPHWAGITKERIEDCRAPLEAVSVALAACWQELAERVGMTSITVQATNIGQKIGKEALESAEVLHDGVT
jgi:hypothetical protein